MKWWQTGIIYQIYPRSFLDSDGNGIGDLKGIIEKLDYLNDGTENSLGIDAIWLSPIYESPMKDHGYDISDFRAIDPIFGKDEDFDGLIEAVHKRGMKIIMDLVVNHTSNQHPWFIESSSTLNNPKRDWYIWKDRIINNWFSEFSLRSSWNLDTNTNTYYYGFFTKEQPELNWRNTEVRKCIYDIIRYWFQRGVDGFRLDVVNYYIKDDQFRNNPWQLKIKPPELQNHIYDRNRPEIYEILKEFRKIADTYPDKMLIGEVYTSDANLAVSYQGNGMDMLHMAYNFDFLFQPFSASAFYEAAIKWYDLLPPNGWPNFTLSNHDQPRHYSRYAKTMESISRAKVAAGMLLTLKGTPTIYYGEEIGMENKKLTKQQLKDPMGLRYYPLYKGRDKSRTPMQWNGRPNAGFSTGKPWLPVHKNYLKNTVDIQEARANSVLHVYKRLIWLRKEYAALSQGDIVFYHKGEREVLGYKRHYHDEAIYVYLNFSNVTREIVRMALEEEVIYSTHRKEGQYLKDAIISLKPYEVLLMR